MQIVDAPVLRGAGRSTPIRRTARYVRVKPADRTAGPRLDQDIGSGEGRYRRESVIGRAASQVRCFAVNGRSLPLPTSICCAPKRPFVVAVLAGQS